MVGVRGDAYLVNARRNIELCRLNLIVVEGARDTDLGLWILVEFVLHVKFKIMFLI